MARPPTIRSEDVLEAARAVLLEKGLSATAADVAARANISEASIFYRFKTKEALFRAAIWLRNPPEWIAGLPTRVGRREVAEELGEITMGALQFFRILIPFVMLSWSKSPDRHVADNGPDPAPIRSLKAVASYFEAEMNLGRIARHDADVVARTFIGAIWNHVSMELMFDAVARMPLPEATFVRSLVRLLLEGLGPKDTALPAKPHQAETAAPTDRIGRSTSKRR